MPPAHERPPSTRAQRQPARRDASGAYPDAVERLLAELTLLPGVGRRGAERIAFALLKADPQRAEGLSRAIAEARKSVRNCAECSNLAHSELCPICASPSRDRSTLLVVEQPRDVAAFERTGMYRGLYHVLLGRLSPLDGVGPDDLTIDALVARVKPGVGPGSPERSDAPGPPIREVVLGLNPTTEGDGTALYLAGLLRDASVRVTRLARGLPTGSQLELASKAALADAISGRRSMEDE